MTRRRAVWMCGASKLKIFPYLRSSGGDSSQKVITFGFGLLSLSMAHTVVCLLQNHHLPTDGWILLNQEWKLMILGCLSNQVLLGWLVMTLQLVSGQIFVMVTSHCRISSRGCALWNCKKTIYWVIAYSGTSQASHGIGDGAMSPAEEKLLSFKICYLP